MFQHGNYLALEQLYKTNLSGHGGFTSVVRNLPLYRYVDMQALLQCTNSNNRVRSQPAPSWQVQKRPHHAVPSYTLHHSASALCARERSAGSFLQGTTEGHVAARCFKLNKT